MGAADSPLCINSLPDDQGYGRGQAVSKQITDDLYRSRNRRRPGSWRDRHEIDADLAEIFGNAAKRVAEQNFPLHRRSFRVNAMLTINSGLIADRDEISYAQVEERLRRNLRNSFRSRGRQRDHRFAGFWRRETFSGSVKGVHCHTLTHLPWGMRARLLQRLPLWTGDPIDPCVTSKRFDRPNWRAVGVCGLWHLCRIYDEGPLIEYLAKVPLGPSGRPIEREARRRHLALGSREFGVFGLD